MLSYPFVCVLSCVRSICVIHVLSCVCALICMFRCVHVYIAHTSNLDFQLTQSPEERNGSTVRWKVSAIVDVSTKKFSYVTAESAQRQNVCGGKTCLGVEA